MDSVYLDEIRTSVRLRPIPWEGYVRANLLTLEEAGPFKSLEKKPVTERDAAVSADPVAYVTPLVELLRRNARDDVVKYLVLFAGDVFPKVAEFAKALLADKSIWDLLAGILDKSTDEQTSLLTARLLASLASTEIAPVATTTKLIAYVGNKLLPSPNANLHDIGVQILALLLQTQAYRSLFWESHKTLVPKINDLVHSPAAGGLQVQYYALLVLWLASFERTIATNIVTDYNTVSVLLNAAKSSVKEKIIRVAVATLVNLTGAAPKLAASALIAQRGIPVITTLSERNCADEELREDIVTLKERLEAAYEQMSTFEVYLAEVRAKHLQWSPPHRSAPFWKQNIAEFRKEDWAVLRQLVKLISTESDVVTEAVVCNDITNIIAEAPDAVTVLQKEGAKARIMQLLNSPDVEVRYEALKATQAFIGHMFET